MMPPLEHLAIAADHACCIDADHRNTVIPYEVRVSERATTKRIEITPGSVAVVVPFGTPLDGPDGVVPFLHRKRRWVFDSVPRVEREHRALLA